MNAFTRTAVGVAFLGSAVLLPWWITVVLGIVLLSQGIYGIVVGGGIIMDYLFGAPVHAIGNFAYVYTTLFAFLAIISWHLQKQVLE